MTVSLLSSSSVMLRPVAATGASLTETTVMVTVSTEEESWPSETLQEKESLPW